MKNSFLTFALLIGQVVALFGTLTLPEELKLSQKLKHQLSEVLQENHQLLSQKYLGQKRLLEHLDLYFNQRLQLASIEQQEVLAKARKCKTNRCWLKSN